VPAFSHIFVSDWVVYSFVIGGLLLDLLVVPLLLWRRTRLVAYEAANKSDEAVFVVTHPGGQTWTIKPEDYLKSHQVMKMTTKPELILHFAHYIAEEKRREGYDNVEVRARVMVSLNGRQPQLLIDSNVDLAKEQVSLLPASWIVPLTTPLRSP